MRGFLLDSPQHEWCYLHYFKFMRFLEIARMAISRDIPMGTVSILQRIELQYDGTVKNFFTVPSEGQQQVLRLITPL